ncbi:MerR family DNA-binding transcriptional regulator [Mycolicibacterium cosmeticum]|jgi:DNA-binding transcriptional MerR regulator|uniref:MerR family transcriptional regulator n=2 Tax=Mycolicibacterium cosmeticum TaxID=258533 RepID=W9BKN1_MYCCO|nr:MerR family DNA-binding transcriptional regulator [Mycolicibacterium cosmeticum]CDO08190.1 MerR family transcriptional regulator [Mycolicibacterium cosmeticum]
MRIGELSNATGVSTRALRYYEEQGLLLTRRASNGYRDYDPDSADIVAFIQDLFRAGLSSAVIREILPWLRSGRQPTADCSEILDRVRQIRDELARREQRIKENRQLLDDFLSGAATPRGFDGLRRCERSN